MAIVGSKLAKILGQAQCTQPTCSECPSIDYYDDLCVHDFPLDCCECKTPAISKKKAQAWKTKTNIPTVSFSIPNNPSSYSTWEKQSNCLVNILDTPQQVFPWGNKKEKTGCKDNQQEKECAMRATIDTTTDSSLDYINNRLSSILWDKSSDIEKKFETVKPKNAKQAKEWLKEGNYRIELPDYYNEDTAGAYLAMEFLAWGKTGPDLKAKAAADESLYKEFQAAKDTVAILSDEQARLKALKDFEAYSVN